MILAIFGVSILHYFFDTTTFTMYMTACRARNLEKSFIFEKTVAIKDYRYFPSMHTHNVVNMCHIHW